MCCSQLCSLNQIPLDTFLVEFKSLSKPERHTEWKDQPIYFLIDFLSREHWHFLQRVLPAIKRSITEEKSENVESLRRIGYLVQEWPKFSSALQEHINEEENFLFPKIIHYDYCYRNQKDHADFLGGSVNVYVALKMLGKETEQMAAIRRFLSEMLFSKAVLHGEDPLDDQLTKQLKDFHEKLIAHSSLESEVLFPMAKAVEKAMMDNQIAGGFSITGKNKQSAHS